MKKYEALRKHANIVISLALIAVLVTIILGLFLNDKVFYRVSVIIFIIACIVIVYYREHIKHCEKEYFLRLSNGLKIPNIGFGMFKFDDNETNYEALKYAATHGYTHFDSATWYQNEHMIKRLLQEKVVKREDIFITTKLHNDTRGYNETLAAIDVSLEKLGCDYIDLYLIHWPAPIKFRENFNEYNVTSYKAMEEAYRQGKIKALGVSNFKVHHLKPLLKAVKIKPMVNQIEIHPHYHDDEVIEFCRLNNICVYGYSALGRGELLQDENVLDMAKMYRKSASQILIRYVLDKGFGALVKSSNPKHLDENLDVYDFNLSIADIKYLDSFNSESGRKSKDPDTSNQ